MDNASLIAMCLVCKQFCTIIQDGHGMDNQLIRVFELRAADKNEGEEEDNRLSAFILNMQRYFENPTKHRILTAHQKIKVYDMQEFMKYEYPGMDMDSNCLLYTSPSPRDEVLSRMPSSA